MITTANIVLFVCLAFGIGVFVYMSHMPVAGENDKDEDDQSTHGENP